jgi:hypothetical protein
MLTLPLGAVPAMIYSPPSINYEANCLPFIRCLFCIKRNKFVDLDALAWRLLVEKGHNNCHLMVKCFIFFGREFLFYFIPQFAARFALGL